MLGSFGVTELLIILFIIIILFGAKRLPDLARGLGQGLTEFKKAARSEPHEEVGPAAKPGSTTDDTK
ncbi:MAG: twin-arginine translocase TatA/TatE family subunit [candidate division Zixibacteria bacterium]|nr:twin-arginine translocase TatA/TatE family subunit [candidate division Zixibacteria bacterium]